MTDVDQHLIEIDWQTIDTVFLDMDGTLLDLYFDNHFWLEHVPRRYAEMNGWSLEEAKEHLQALYASRIGTLDWYCIDYWSDQLGLDILTLKQEVEHLIRMHPHVEEFLNRLHGLVEKSVLVTNAHPGTLAFKLERVPLGHYFDALVTSHELGLPKEDVVFWDRLQKVVPYDPARTLFVDDSISVLNAAKKAGIGTIVAIHSPDSRQPQREIADFPAIPDFSALL